MCERVTVKKESRPGANGANLQDLYARLPFCMARDRFRLRQRLAALGRANAPSAVGLSSSTEPVAGLVDEIARSCAQVDRRAQTVPEIVYPEQLPISGKSAEIRRALLAHQVIIVAGETGSGKTTQLPKICLQAGRGITGLIGHTQPRRIAARTVATRIAEELGLTLGETVGYQVRFQDNSTDSTLIKLMTDGILLADIQRDRFFSRYDTIIIDEAHERSLNIDFLLGYLKRILPKRPDLKVIVTSATIDVQRFSEHFGDAPVIEVSGRTFPVAYRYRPPQPDTDIYQAINAAVDELLKAPEKGDILVFLSGEREIREAALSLRRCAFPHLEVLPLYGRLNTAEQNCVFQAHKGMRVVLATNVAETSLTVPGIRYVIDTGLARVSRYNYRSKVQQLPVEPISQASANQRAGRCGRLGDGICIRLYSEDDFNNRSAFTPPEILRTNLAAVILQMLRLRIGDVRRFPFMEPPNNRLINDGVALLEELQAIDRRGRLNETGRKLAQFNVDPRLAKMLVAAAAENCVREVLIIVAALSIPDPRERPADKRAAADQKHRQWQDKNSDFIGIVTLWRHFEEQRQGLSRNQFAKYCRQCFVSYPRMVEWRDLHHQLHNDCRRANLRLNAEAASVDSVHRALLAGLITHVGFRREGREYLGVRNRKFLVFPGSALAAKPPKWIMSAELLETSNLYGHFNAGFNIDWLPALAEHLVKKQYSEPYYDVRNGQVMAYERQILFGLTIVERKKVPYTSIEPVVCREIFIQSALVEGAYLRADKRRRKLTEVGGFARHNAELLAQLHDLEERMRRRDIVADERALFEFYDARIPQEVVSLSTFERWRRRAERANARLLYIDRERLLVNAPAASEQAQFPKTLEWDDVTYTLSYLFAPGDEQDGVSIDVPLDILHQLPAHLGDWLVPGLLRDKCIALIKGLPKNIRRQVVPIPDFVDRVLSRIRPENRPLHQVLGAQLEYLADIKVKDESWQPQKLDRFYQMNYRLRDARGAVLEQSRDLAELRQRFRQRVQNSISNNAEAGIERRGITRWDFGELPDVYTVQKGVHLIRTWPALRDEHISIALILCDNPNTAALYTEAGLTRLAMLETPQTVKYLRKNLLKSADLILRAAHLPARDKLVDDIMFAAYYETCVATRATPRNAQQFAQQLAEGKDKVVAAAGELASIIETMTPELKALHAALLTKKTVFPDVVSDIDSQLNSLFAPGFCYRAGLHWFRQYPRYVKAAVQRLERFLKPTEREQGFQRAVAEFTVNFGLLAEAPQPHSKEVRQQIRALRFMLEEYRVSHYAQQLKTVMPVSAKRLARQLENLQQQMR